MFLPYINHLIRFLVSSFILLLVGYLVPGFSIRGFGTAILAAAVITAIGWIAEALFDREISPYGRGLVGFLSTSLIIYITKFIVPGVSVTIIGALLAALLMGIIDLFLPSRSRFWRANRPK